MSEKKPLQVMATRGVSQMGTLLYIRQRLDNGKWGYVSMSEREGWNNPQPIDLSDYEARLLMDALWSLGIRPTEDTSLTEILHRTEAHLASLKEENQWLREYLTLLLKGKNATEDALHVD